MHPKGLATHDHSFTMDIREQQLSNLASLPSRAWPLLVHDICFLCSQTDISVQTLTTRRVLAAGIV